MGWGDPGPEVVHFVSLAALSVLLQVSRARGSRVARTLGPRMQEAWD